MKKDNKKALYESIMTSVAREVKKTLNEGELNNRDFKIHILPYERAKGFQIDVNAEKLCFIYPASETQIPNKTPLWLQNIILRSKIGQAYYYWKDAEWGSMDSLFVVDDDKLQYLSSLPNCIEVRNAKSDELMNISQEPAEIWNNKNGKNEHEIVEELINLLNSYENTVDRNEKIKIKHQIFNLIYELR